MTLYCLRFEKSEFMDGETELYLFESKDKAVEKAVSIGNYFGVSIPSTFEKSSFYVKVGEYGEIEISPYTVGECLGSF